MFFGCFRCSKVDLDIIVQENQLIEEVLKNCPQIIPVYYLYWKYEEDFISLLTPENRVNLVDGSDGYDTYLQYACLNYLPKVVRALLKHGANPNSTTPRNLDYPLFIASFYGYADIVQIFLDTKNPNIIFQMHEHNTNKINVVNIEYTSALHKVIVGTEYNDFIVHEFCNYDKTFELLLPICSKIDINYADYAGRTCLHVAGYINKQHYVHSLLDCGAYLGIINGESPLSDISSNVLESYLNKCVDEDTDWTKNDRNYNIRCTHKFLCPPKVDTVHDISNKIQLDDQSDQSGIVLQNISEIEPLLTISKIPELKHLLLHPVLLAFFHLKWSKIQKYYNMYLTGYVMFLFCLNSYILCNIENNNERSFCSIIDWWKFLLFALITLIIRELIKIIFLQYKYIKYFENWLKICLIILTSILLCKSCFKEILDLISVIAIQTSWIELMFILGNYHRFAVQFATFKVIFKNFLHLLLWYSGLIIAFILSFYVVFEKKENSVFKDLFSVAFKTVVMLVGEFNVDDLPFSNRIVGRILIIFFTLIVSIVLVNTLNGLAVSDVKKIRNDAEIISLVSRMHLIHIAELVLIDQRFNTNIINYFLFRKYMKDWFESKIRLFPNALNYPFVEIFPNENNRVRFYQKPLYDMRVMSSPFFSYSTIRIICKKISILNALKLHFDDECVLRAKAIIKSNAIKSKKIKIVKINEKNVLTKMVNKFKELLTKEKEKKNNEENMNIIYKAVEEIKEIINSDDKTKSKEECFNILIEEVKQIKNMLITKNT